MELEAIIGLEIHVQLKTKSKMFSSALVSFGCPPNTNVDLSDMAFPGSLPTVNKKAVIYAIQMANALHMQIDDTLIFERKNYFYSDLPKGYQLTQHYRPIGKNGYVEIEEDGKIKRIGILQLHIEEDACKQMHLKNKSLLDFNRAGIPLLEIVSLPEINSGREAAKYVEEIRSIVTYLNISDGKMEEGSLRVDINVSVKEKGSLGYGTKVEIKNLNSISNIQKAIDYEINRQQKIILSNEKVKKETRRYNEKQKKTELMRIKLDSVDYKYFTDPNIVPIKLSEDFIKSAIDSSPELAKQKLERYLSYGVSNNDARQLLADKDISNYFETGMKKCSYPKEFAKWINQEVLSYLNRYKISILDFNVSPSQLVELINLIKNNAISNKQAKQVFDKMVEANKDAKEIIDGMELTQESDETELTKIIDEILEKNNQAIIDYQNGRDKAIRYLIGEVMKVTRGKANPSLTNKLIKERIERR